MSNGTANGKAVANGYFAGNVHSPRARKPVNAALARAINEEQRNPDASSGVRRWVVCNIPLR